ncbi:alpha-L-fucosidase [Lacticaseibacillus pabuli]|uniref:alpha-L-fucosidase n=1 Tax=Lacticaseibacillus pabuli TaxID=3025672 RepID=A0ABY7WNF8_9LACO|nr:alpha-L-fucosidase [Lacticaseibacillus sp. KACC 23028]WDF81719.1 alpha-L-fucosidase [Lacticaseibacillus sp. KACC 23028]
MDTVNRHREQAPSWFQQADFGIFIHWGLYSVPAYAPAPERKHHTFYTNFKYQPYAEWYANSMLFPTGPTGKYHQEHYGNMPYEDFALTFRQQARQVDVDAWADKFAAAHAKYVVVVTKHHDGFVMYDTKVQNPVHPGYNLDFDFIGMLAKAVRARGMRFGVYYSSLLDWSFRHDRVQSAASFLLDNPNTQAYRDYVWAQWHELIDRYHPDILWSDIGYPVDSRLPQLFRDYYAAVPDGMVNDRWSSYPNWLRHRVLHPLFNLGGAIWQESHQTSAQAPAYYDYRTLEYTTDWHQDTGYYEITRGIDQSFGYNQFSRPQDFITADEVRRIIAEARPHNGRLLLNVGPMANGTIPAPQQAVLTDLASQAL